MLVMVYLLINPLYLILQNESANRDPRVNATIYFPGDLFLTDINRTFSGNSPTGYAQRKYIRREETNSEGGKVIYSWFTRFLPYQIC